MTCVLKYGILGIHCLQDVPEYQTKFYLFALVDHFNIFPQRLAAIKSKFMEEVQECKGFYFGKRRIIAKEIRSFEEFVVALGASELFRTAARKHATARQRDGKLLFIGRSKGAKPESTNGTNATRSINFGLAGPISFAADCKSPTLPTPSISRAIKDTANRYG